MWSDVRMLPRQWDWPARAAFVVVWMLLGCHLANVFQQSKLQHTTFTTYDIKVMVYLKNILQCTKYSDVLTHIHNHEIVRSPYSSIHWILFHNIKMLWCSLSKETLVAPKHPPVLWATGRSYDLGEFAVQVEDHTNASYRYRVSHPHHHLITGHPNYPWLI